MIKPHWSLLFLYFVAAAAFGGWCGNDVWNSWGIWCFLLPPFAWATVKYIGAWRLNRDAATIVIGVVMTAFAVIVVGGTTVLLSGLVADNTRWFNTPVVRASVGAGVVAALGVAMWFGRKSDRPAEAGAMTDSDLAEAGQ